jgi:hypothetical protein
MKYFYSTKNLFSKKALTQRAELALGSCSTKNLLKRMEGLSILQVKREREPLSILP